MTFVIPLGSASVITEEGRAGRGGGINVVEVRERDTALCRRAIELRVSSALRTRSRALSRNAADLISR